MKVKRVVALLLVTMLLVGNVLTGCGSTNPSTNTGASLDNASGEKVELTFWTLSTRQAAVDPIVEAYMAENPNIKVTVSYYDTDGIKDACKVASSSGTLPNMWFNWGGSLGGFYVDNGLTYDLSDYAAAHNWNDVFTSGALSLCTFDGQLAGYPTSFNVLGVYYRKDIFDKYGLEIPTTFEEFENICAVLKENGITPLSTAGLYGWHVMRVVELLIEHYAGAELHDKLNSFQESWENDKVIKALAKYQEFCQKGYFPDGFVTADPNDTQLAVFTGQAAMDVQGQWYDGNIISAQQDMNNFGVFSLPTSGTNRMSAFAEMVQFNAKNTDAELEASIDFINYYHSDENINKYGEYFNLPLPKIGAKMPEGQPNVEVMMNMSGNTGTFTITDQAFTPEIADGLFDVQAAIASNQMTPEEGAKAIQAAIDNYHSK